MEPSLEELKLISTALIILIHFVYWLYLIFFGLEEMKSILNSLVGHDAGSNVPKNYGGGLQELLIIALPLFMVGLYIYTFIRNNIREYRRRRMRAMACHCPMCREEDKREKLENKIDRLEKYIAKNMEKGIAPLMRCCVCYENKEIARVETICLTCLRENVKGG